MAAFDNAFSPFRPFRQHRGRMRVAAVSALALIGSLVLVPHSAQAAETIGLDATITVAEGGVSLDSGWSTSDVGAASGPAATVAAGGSTRWQVPLVTSGSGVKTGGDFGYRIVEHGAPTAYSVSGSARYLSGQGVEEPVCNIYRNSADGTGVIVDQATDSPYVCTITGTRWTGERFTPTFTVSALAWATVHAAVAPQRSAGHDISLAEGAFSSGNSEFLVNGALVRSGSEPDDVPIPAGHSAHLAAFLRNAESGVFTHRASVDFSYRIVEDGTPSPFWVGGYAENHREGTFSHSSECKLYLGDPADGGAAVDFSPYECEMSGENLDGRGVWQVTFIVTARDYTMLGGAEANRLLERGCTVDGASCVYIPQKMETITRGDLVNLGSHSNSSEEAIDSFAIEWFDERSVYHSFSISTTFESEENALFSSMKVSLELTYKYQVKTVKGTKYTHEIEIPGHTTKTAWLGPAYQRVTGDYFFEFDGAFYRVLNTTVDLPDPTNPGSVTTTEVPYHQGGLGGALPLPPVTGPPATTPLTGLDPALAPLNPAIAPLNAARTDVDPAASPKNGASKDVLAATGTDTYTVLVLSTAAAVLLILGGSLWFLGRRRSLQVISRGH